MSKKGAKKGKKLTDVLAPEDMKPEQILEHMLNMRTEMEAERAERDLFIQERDRMALALDIMKSKLEEKEAENRNTIFDMEKQQEKHNFESKVMKQKIKYLMFENQKKVEETVNENNQSMKAVQDEAKSELQYIRNELKNLKTLIKTEQGAHELSVKNLKVKHADDMANINQDFERRVSEIETKYKNKIAAREAENDLKFRNELHEVEERKNFEVFSLMQTHDRLYKDMKDYYNDITLNGINLINGLKQECENLRKKDDILEKKMAEMTAESKMNSQKMGDMAKGQKENLTKLKRLNHVKYVLKEKDHRIRVMEGTATSHEKEIEVLHQLLKTIKSERDELYGSFTSAIHEIHQKAGMKNCLLEIKLESMEKELDLTFAQLETVIKEFNLDSNLVAQLTKSVKDVVNTKNNTIKDMQYELARVCKAHNDLMKTYESRLKSLKISCDETGFFPVKTVNIDDSTLGGGAAGLISKCL